MLILCCYMSCQQQRSMSPSNSHVLQSAVAKLQHSVVGFVVINDPPWTGRIPSVQSASRLSDCGAGHVFSKSTVAYSTRIPRCRFAMKRQLLRVSERPYSTADRTHRFVSLHISTPHQLTGPRRIFCPLTCWQAALMGK